MPRKITQIASDNDRLIALCGDGTMWMLDLVELPKSEWEELPEIPGNKNQKKKTTKPEDVDDDSLESQQGLRRQAQAFPHAPE